MTVEQAQGEAEQVQGEARTTESIQATGGSPATAIQMSAAKAAEGGKAGPARKLIPEVKLPPRPSLERLPEEDQQLLVKVLSEPVEYMDNDLFARPRAEVELMGHKAALLDPQSTDFAPMPPLRAGEPVHAGVSALSADEEKTLFLRLNYTRYRVYRIVEAHTKKRLPIGKARHLLAWSHRVLRCRADIVRTNIPLVLAMAKRTRLATVDFSELISEGNMALLRSADKFDCGRGFKFSTYACRAILKSFSRVAMKASRYRVHFPTEFDPSLERSDFAEQRREDDEADCVDEVRSLISGNRADLNPVELTVIRERFALAAPGGDEPSPKTLEQVGEIIGVTKERVRQIQNKALSKLRQALEDEYLAA
jgi:RNA polymerase sigma factor (sigma-70 family)